MPLNTVYSPRKETITARLDSVIEKRLPILQRIQRVYANLQSFKEILQKLENCRQTLRLSPDDTNTVTQVNDIRLSGLLKRIDFQLQQLEKLKIRYDRGTIDFAVVGLMGQGKSTFLKAVSGLPNEIIPARGGYGACTAVRSNIYHQAGENKFQVVFHTEASFLKDIITPYYIELGLGEAPKNLDEFKGATIPIPEGTTQKAMYERLKDKYQAHLEQYKPRLRGQTIEVSETEIVKYVTHNEESFEYLAVKQANIFCPFRKTEVARVGLKDLPGLGDLRVGDEKLMKDTIGQEVDVVLFIRCPDARRSSWTQHDTQLYETAKQAFKELQDSIQERSLMILNHDQRQKDSRELCEKHQANIGKEHIEVAKCFITDCSNSEQVHELLDFILAYLAEDVGGISRIEALDNRQVSQQQERLDILEQDINEELEKARPMLAKYADDGERFNERFKEFDEQVSHCLTQLRDRLREQREVIDADFDEKVQLVLTACEQDSGIPDEVRIKKEYPKMASAGSYNVVCGMYFAEMRTKLSQHFLTLNRGLKQSLENLKQEVTQILYHEINLGKLTPSGESQFLQEMVDLLTEQANPLELGFRTLLEAQVSYEGLILADLREHLDYFLDADKNSLILEDSAEPSALVKAKLEQRHQEFMAECKNTLNDYLIGPSRVKYALTQEFVDQILYAKDMKDKWRNFLSKPQIRNLVWTEFQAFEKRKQIQDEWKTLIQHAQKLLEQPQSLKFVL